MNLAKSSFIKPHFNQEAGYEGLSSHDIAKGIGADNHQVFQKIARNEEFLIKSGFRIYARKLSDTGGRNGKDYFVCTDTSKYLVASWKNHMGASYFRFLLECERVATELTPKLIARIAELEGKSKTVKSSKSKMIDVPVYDYNLFGDYEVVTYNKVPKEKVSDVVQMHSYVRHCNKVAMGCLKKVEVTQKKIETINHTNKVTVLKLKH
jgi:hypothetical protein